ncbi:hypothetical protein [Nitrosomonas oligotropha]|nr:hypothetical protein [Nitrosomonas oligotropha]
MKFDLLETQAATCDQSTDSDSMDSDCLTGVPSEQELRYPYDNG